MMDGSDNGDVFNPSTNWRVAGGDLRESISFESEDQITPAAVDHVAKSPLFLLPGFPDGEPCEITITFAQEHELRQIYIRSSARVYEVYYTKRRQHDKEYLCTVRCGLAEREEQGLHSLSSKTNEDGWVDLKAAHASVLNNEKDLLLQDFFEATAEINDAEPCISITLRLLSLRDKTYALVDEVYVFADPIDPSESDQGEASGTGNSSTSSMMAMLMPTLLQLSRGKDVSKEHDRLVSHKPNTTTPVTFGNSNDSCKMVNEIQQETSFSKDDHRGVSSPVLVDAPQVSGAEFKPSMSYSNVETILHQLVNKVSRIETILTRFEDQILRPISSIDARLQVVEKKFELLGKKSFDPELLVETNIPYPDTLSSDTGKTPEANELDQLTKNANIPRLASCSTMVAPDSSSTDSREDCADVPPNNVVENISTKIVELECENNSISGNDIFSASAESEINNAESDHSLGRGACEETPKHSVSINDALASALAGLLSSTSITDRKYSQALIDTAPEFSNEDDMEAEKITPTGTHPDSNQSGAEELGNTNSALESPTFLQKEPVVTLCIEEESKEISRGVFDNFGDSVEEYDDAEIVLSIRNGDADEDTVTSRTEGAKLSYEPRDHDEMICEGEPGRDDVLKSLLGFQPTNCSVDFQTPVLDVKFNLEEKASDNECFFEALLRAEAKTVVECNKEVLDENLVSVEDEEVIGAPTDTLSSVELDHYETNEIHLQLDTELIRASLL